MLSGPGHPESDEEESASDDCEELTEDADAKEEEEMINGLRTQEEDCPPTEDTTDDDPPFPECWLELEADGTDEADVKPGSLLGPGCSGEEDRLEAWELKTL